MKLYSGQSKAKTKQKIRLGRTQKSNSLTGNQPRSVVLWRDIAAYFEIDKVGKPRKKKELIALITMKCSKVTENGG